MRRRVVGTLGLASAFLAMPGLAQQPPAGAGAKDHVAVHEFVHYLQHESGRFDLSSCVDTDKREREAFRVQSRFVAEVQNGFTRFVPVHLACKPEP